MDSDSFSNDENLEKKLQGSNILTNNKNVAMKTCIYIIDDDDDVRPEKKG